MSREDQDSERRAVIMVLGMHRSGTSAMTRALNFLGAEIPGSVMGPSEFNRRGHWESNELRDLHDEYLRELGSAWDDWRDLRPVDELRTSVMAIHNRIRGLVVESLANANTLVVKDPRVCRFFPFWHKLLEELGVDVKVLLPIRNPLEVAHSLESRDQFPVTKSLLLWLRHVLDAERASRGLARVFVTYEELLRNPMGVVDKVVAGLDLSKPAGYSDIVSEIKDFVSADDRHFRFDKTSVAAYPEMVDWVADAYREIVRIAESGDPTLEPDRAIFDEIRCQFDRCAEPYYRPNLVLQSEDLGRRLESELRHIDAIREKDAMIAELMAAAEQRRELLEANHAALLDLQGQLESKDVAIHELHATVEKNERRNRAILDTMDAAIGEFETAAEERRELLETNHAALLDLQVRLEASDLAIRDLQSAAQKNDGLYRDALCSRDSTIAELKVAVEERRVLIEVIDDALVDVPAQIAGKDVAIHELRSALQNNELLYRDALCARDATIAELKSVADNAVSSSK